MGTTDGLFGLVFASILPIIFSVLFHLLNRKTNFGKLNSVAKQLIIGFVFGLLSISGSELGYPYLGVQLNCRDAAPVCAGLFFGPIAGVLSGLMGGIERWFAVYWGAGTLTRLACTLGTIFAGLHAAFLRKFLFNNHRPFWLLAVAIAIISEVVHLILIIVTNMQDVATGYNIIYNVAIILIILNSSSVGISGILLSLISNGKLVFDYKKRRITQSIQRWIIISFAIALSVSTWFLYSYQTSLAKQQAKSTMELAIKDVEGSIEDICDEELLYIARQIKPKINNDLNELAEEYNVSVINVVNSEGVVARSNIPEYIGFYMDSGDQAREFLALLGDKDEFAQKYGPMTSRNDNDEIQYMKYVGLALDKGFFQVGYDAKSFQSLISERIVEIASNRHIGDTGSVVVLDNDYNIVYVPDYIQTQGGEQIDILAHEPYSLQECTLNGTEYFYSYNENEGYLLVSLYPKKEAYKSRDISLYINSFVEVIIFGFLFIMVYKFIDSSVVNKIQDFKDSLSKISEGDLDNTVNIRNNLEYSELSDDINKTVGTLKKYISDAEQRNKSELDLANSIQKSSLPIVTPIISRRGDFEIAPFMATAKEVGGDFYDFYFTDGHTLNFCIADVSGKGIPAALFMMRAKTELRSLSENGFPVNEVLEKGNAALCDGNDAGMFVTCWQGRINLHTGLVQYANGGHNPPVVKKKDGTTYFLKGKVNFILGGMDNSKYSLQEIKLDEGDIIFLYTDGVTEATNSEKKLFGEERLRHYIETTDFENMSGLCNGVMEDINSFVLDAPQFDDITMVALKYNGIVDTKGNDDLMKVTNVRMNVECKDWKDAIVQATSLLARAGSVHESYADDLIRTVEELGPYIVLLPGFALAHTDPGKKSVYQNDISLITLKNGVNFGSPNDPVRVVMAISCLDGDSHVKILQTIATKLMDNDAIDKILHCKDEFEIVSLLKKNV